MSFSQQPLRYRVGRGVAIGLAVAVALCIWAGIVVAAKTLTHGRPMPITLRQITIAYLVGAPLGGAIGGIGAPLMKSALGAFLLGFMVVYPVAQIASSYYASDQAALVRLGVAILEACIGGAVALTVRNDPSP